MLEIGRSFSYKWVFNQNVFMKVSLLKMHSAPAFLGTTYKYSYSDLLGFVDAAAKRIPQNLVRAAIFAENSPEWVVAFYAVWKGGACAVPVDAKLNEDELEYILRDCFPEVVFTDEGRLETVKKVVEKFENKPQVILLSSVISTAATNSGVDFSLEREEEDMAVIVYTSGTTGSPKGVMLSFKNLRANVESVAEAGYYYEFMRVLIMLPFHHILPLMGTVIGPMFVGGTMIFAKSLAVTDISAILREHPATMIVGVPRFYELIHANIKEKINASKILKGLLFFAKTVGSKRLSRLIFGSIHRRFGGKVKFWITGGAALNKDVWADMAAMGFSIFEGYGMTECAPIITFPRPDWVKIGSSGKPITGMEVRIVDGEVAVRGDNVTEGYFGKPEETALSIRNGWLYTGDIGHFDDDGFLFITGRRKEIIVLQNGKNIDPSELEAHIKSLSPEILEVGVTMYEDILQAIICFKPAFVASMDDVALQAHVRDHVILPYNRSSASYKRIIRFVATAKELPRTRVGKLKRFHLPAYLESIKEEVKGDQPLKPEPEDKIYRELKSLVSSQIPVPVMPDAHIEMDLGLDSLGKISLQCHIKENYSVDVSEADFEKYSTLRALSEFVTKERLDEDSHTSKAVTWKEIIKSHTGVRLPKTNFFHFVSIIFFRTAARLFYRIDVKGFENVPASGPVIIAPNHESYMDGIFAAFPFSKTKLYKTYFFAKVRSMIRSGLIRFYAGRSNVIIMDINDNVRESLQKLAQVLSKGCSVIIFPEGTRTRDGAIAEFKQSFAILSKELGVPVVPTVISGAFEALKGRGSLPKFGAKIGVEYLPAMLPEADDTYESFSKKVKDAVEAAKTGNNLE